MGWFYDWTERLKRASLHAPGGKHWRKQTVPHTRKFKASRRYYRYPKTLQEIRYNANAHDEEARFYKIQPPRRNKKVPNAWDDLVGWVTNNNWKNFRTTQWKVDRNPK